MNTAPITFPLDVLMAAAPTRPSKHGNRPPMDGPPASPTRATRDKPGVPLLQHSVLGLQQSTSVPLALKPQASVTPLPMAAVGLVDKIRETAPFVLQPPEEQTDNWDDDFEDGPSFTKLQGTPYSKYSFILHLLTVFRPREDRWRG